VATSRIESADSRRRRRQTCWPRAHLGRYHDIGSYTSINGDNLEALASPDYGTTHREFTGWDWNRLTTTVSPFYNLMLADCGSRLSAPAAAGVLATVSRVVIMAGAS
jgi:MinD-like ATPase involved in chromosome partitioning or flagellar assembly